MEERNNKSNTMLLTVIAIATLLVAVIGATFAYFTAQIGNAESNSTVILQGTTLTISFADGNPNLAASTGLIPVKSVSGTFAPVITKNFSLTASNPSTSTVNYSLYLVVTENNFALQDRPAEGTANTSLQYKLIKKTSAGGELSEAAASLASANFVNIPVYDKDNLDKDAYTHDSDSQYGKLQTVELYENSTYAIRLHGDTQNRGIDGGNEQGTLVYGLRLGSGSIAANSNITHSYELSIYFNENTLNQDYDKGSTFSGYVAIDADPITPAA